MTPKIDDNCLITLFPDDKTNLYTSLKNWRGGFTKSKPKKIVVWLIFTNAE